MAEAAYTPISPSVSAEEIMKYYKPVKPQVDGSGLRVGNKAEFTLIAPVQPGGVDVFRQRVEKLQTEAAYWEGKLGTVHDVRIALLGDQHILFAATYSDDFKPYVLDVIKFATPWIDYMFKDVAEGFPGLASPDATAYIARYQVQADIWFASNADMTVRDTTKAFKIQRIFDDLLDAVQS